MVLIFMLAMAGCSSKSTNQSSDSPMKSTKATGGELRVAISAQPPTIDPLMATAVVTRDISRQLYETLFVFNSKFEPVPMLAESYEKSEDGKKYTFHLRKGVKFHNGKEMTAADVVPSMNRWLEKSRTAQALLKNVSFKEIDNYTVELQLTDPSFMTLTALSATVQAAAIMPKEVIEKATATGVQEHIGTGPFKFVEWKQDQYIHLTKFKDYQPLSTPADGLSGKKEALVNDIYFDFVSDASTKAAGLQTGQYYITDTLSADYEDQLKSTPDIKTLWNYDMYSLVYLNKKNGLFKNVKMRQAVNAAVDVESIAKGAFVNNVRPSSSYMSKDLGGWYSDAGKENYNQHNLEKAKQLLKEADYKGEEVKIISSREYEYVYNGAIVLKEQLEKLGLNVKIEVYDWATLINKIYNDPTSWDLYFIDSPQAVTPNELLFFNDKFFDGPKDEKTNSLLKSIRTSSSMDEAKKYWEELQSYSYEFLPVIKITDVGRMSAYNTKAKGYKYFQGPILWNTESPKK